MEMGLLRRTLGCGLIAGCCAIYSFGYAEEELQANVLQIDHAVPHISTVGANADELVHIFVRELVREPLQEPDDKQAPRKAVLMVHGRNTPALAVFDLRHKDYSWAMQLAKADFDVFVVDLQGSGRSPLPSRSIPAMADPCNVSKTQQTQYLIQHPPFLKENCEPSFPYILINSKSEWDEVNTVVDFIIAQRGVDKVALIGISRGSIVVGPYATLHPEKVESLFLQAPNLNAAALPGMGDDGLAPPVKSAGQLPDLSTRFVPCTSKELNEGSCPGILADATRPHRILPAAPNANFPAAMTLSNRQDLIDRWNRDVECDGQLEEGIQERAWRASMENDELGSTWGPPPAGAAEGSAPEGLMRNRSFFAWGWTPAVAEKVQVPTLIVFGDRDKEEGAPGLPLAVTSVRLYDKIPVRNDVAKLLFKVACAGHLMFWERQRKVLHHLSKQWLKHGSVDGLTSGKFFIDTEGNIAPMP